jgi:LPXTG-motif cell wall-anchored protein
MRRTTLAKLMLVLAGLMVLGIAPARAAESLVLTCKVCTEVIITGKGLPANADVRVSLADVATGQEVTSPVPATTDADGAFVKKVNVDLTKHPSLESSVWKAGSGGVLVVAAHTRFDSPCKPKAAADQLPLTGSRSSLLLGVGAALLALGALLVGGARLRFGHAR